MAATVMSPITGLYPIDDEKLNAAGVTYVAINEPKLIVAIAGNTMEIDISQDWEQVRTHLVEQSKHYLSDNDTLSRLETYVGMLYTKNADLITKIVDKIDKAGAGDNKKAKEALALAEKHSKELFLNEYGRAYAAIYVNDGDHVEIHPMNEGKFRRWISGLYFKETNKILGDGDIDKVIRILEGKAEFEGNVKRHKLDLRVRGYNSGTGEGVDNPDFGTIAQATYDEYDEDIENFTEIYYDLTNRNWEAVKITPNGWEIVRDPPILFRRHGSEQPQIYPSRQYPVDILDQYIGLQNIKNENHKFLKKVWIVACFWPNTTPKPIMMVNAPQGSAKSTMSDMDRDLVDPNVVRTSSLPKEDFNLKQHLAHNYMSSFDNVSYISDEHSDTLCRAVTGGRDTKRKLYEDDEDIIYSYKRIISLNGIVNAATKPDLLDRGLIIELNSISKQERELLKRIRRKFKVIKPQLVGFCLDVISEVMAEREKWRNSDPDYYGLKRVVDENGGVPRLADYATLGEQIAAIVARKEGKPYKPGDFLKEWDSNYNNLNVEALKSSLLAEALITFMTDREASKKENAWEGSATQLLSDLNYFISQHDEITIDIHSKAWPNDPTRLGRELARIKTNLEPLGIKVESKRTNVNIIHTITKSPSLPTQPTQATQTEKSHSDEGRSSVGTNVTELTPQPTRPEGDNEHENDDSVGSVGSVGKNGILGDGLVYTMIKIAMRDESGGTANNKEYFLGKVFVSHLMNQPATKMTEDEAEQTLQALVDDGTIEEIGHDQYRPVIIQKIQALNWW